MARGRVRIVAGIVTALAVSGLWAGVASAAPEDEATRVAGAEQDPTPAGSPLMLPDLTFAHRLGSGGMNLWRMPLSELEEGYGRPQLVRTLNTGGFSFDRSRTLSGDFGDITEGDDGTADHVIWHGTADGSIKVWGIGGGSDTAPRLWHTLPHSRGWTWANSRPTVGDVDGDGWDDLVVRHAARAGDLVWVLRSNGQRLLAPVRWTEAALVPRFALSREVSGADLAADGADALLSVGTMGTEDGQALAYAATTSFAGFGGAGWAFIGQESSGWSFARSRQLIGDVTGDGYADIVTVHGTARHPGILLWVHENCEASEFNANPDCFLPPRLWRTMSSGGWSFANSRQYLADTDGDYVLDLVSVHHVGSGGMIVWRQLSNGSTFGSPQLVADLRTGGWAFSRSRESVADTWGVLVD